MRKERLLTRRPNSFLPVWRPSWSNSRRQVGASNGEVMIGLSANATRAILLVVGAQASSRQSPAKGITPRERPVAAYWAA